MNKDALTKLRALEPLIDAVNNEEITAMTKFLYDRISHPDSYLVFLGETSSGKSSIINGLIGKDILPVKASPSTGAITEVELVKNIVDEEYFALNKNATIERLDTKLFRHLCEHPDNNLKRLKLRTSTKYELNGLRIFDTPGYGSIVKEHDEVLKDFLPNSDVVVYTVLYKIGIQEDDYSFLSFLKELIRDDVEVILVVNRCPEIVNENDPRVREIARYVNDILGKPSQLHLVKNIQAMDTDESPVLPQCHSLWESISVIVNSEKRQHSLANAFNGYVLDLYNNCNGKIASRYVNAMADLSAYEELLRIQKETADRIREAIPNLIEPTFDKIEKALPKKFTETKKYAGNVVNSEIEKSDKTDMSEVIAYVNSHLLPHTIKLEVKERVQNYIDIVLSDLNQRVDDYIQKEYIKFNNRITIALQTNMEIAASQVLSNMLKNLGRNSLQGYFTAFGGMGGANAGVANAASHLLKKAGDWFGHTFSRSTHNGVKHFLSKIGATSMKTVGATVAVIVEMLFMTYELATWKGKAKKKVLESLNKWEEKTLPTVIEDLHKLREQNVETVSQIAYNIETSFDDVKPKDVDKCLADYELSKQIGRELFNLKFE